MTLNVLETFLKIKFSEKGRQEIRDLTELVDKAIVMSIEAFEKWDPVIAQKAIELEGKIDAKEQMYRDNHISRLGKAECEPKAGIVFLDLLSNLERAGDHANNIARKILEIGSFS